MTADPLDSPAGHPGPTREAEARAALLRLLDLLAAEVARRLVSPGDPKFTPPSRDDS